MNMDRYIIARNNSLLSVYEWLFYLFVLMLAMFPGRFAFTLEWMGSSVDFPLFLMWTAVIVFLPVTFIMKEHYTSRETAFILVLFILTWALISLDKDPIRSDVYLGDRLIPLLLMGTTVLLGYMFSKIVSSRAMIDRMEWDNIITRFSFVLTFIVMVYAAESLFGLGLRSEAASAVNEELGLVRLKGPLGGSAIMPMVMIITIGVHLGNVINKRKPGIVYKAALLFMLVALLLTGSRSAVLAVGIFGLLILFRMRSITRVFQLAVAAMLAVVVCLPFISFNRISNMEDQSRYQTFLTGMNVVAESPKILWFGRGSSTVWTWYFDERISAGARIWPHTSAYGYTLYHPHSTFLELLVELGIIPFAAFLILIAILIRRLYASDEPDSIRPYVIAGVVSSMGMFVFDLFLFKNFQLSMIWWAFAFTVLALKPGRNRT